MSFIGRNEITVPKINLILQLCVGTLITNPFHLLLFKFQAQRTKYIFYIYPPETDRNSVSLALLSIQPLAHTVWVSPLVRKTSSLPEAHLQRPAIRLSNHHCVSSLPRPPTRIFPLIHAIYHNKKALPGSLQTNKWTRREAHKYCSSTPRTATSSHLLECQIKEREIKLTTFFVFFYTSITYINPTHGWNMLKSKAHSVEVIPRRYKNVGSPTKCEAHTRYSIIFYSGFLPSFTIICFSEARPHILPDHYYHVVAFLLVLFA